jgi:phosphatidate cytidylyltransferase
MKDLVTRGISGVIYASLLLLALNQQYALVILFFTFGLICLIEFKKLINLKHPSSYVIFGLLYAIFGFWNVLFSSTEVLDEAIKVLLVITIFVLLLLIKDLFSEKTIPLFHSKRFILTTFYLSSGFIFLSLIGNFNHNFTPGFVLVSFVLVWVNDTFAYLVGKNFGKQKLFESVSPKKTVEGFLGGLFFACVTSYIVYIFNKDLSSTNWLFLAIIISVFGTIGDLIESKFKRQAKVKDSGVLMPGHGGLLDRLDSIIFAAPFIYLFLRIVDYVS